MSRFSHRDKNVFDDNLSRPFSWTLITVIAQNLCIIHRRAYWRAKRDAEFD